MSELLLELFSEEIPARMQAKAASDLQRLVQEKLFAAGYQPEGAKAFATPRRLTLVVAGLPATSPDRKEEKKGPRVGAPEKAVEGFLKSAGLASLEQCETREDKKGEYYVAVIDEKGRPTAELIAEIVPDVVRAFPWPKSMRWGAGELKWVRPLSSILCVYDGEIVPFEIDGIASGDITYGHRTHAPGAIQARSFEPYEEKLRAARVVLDAEERRETILAEARTLCDVQGLELLEDMGLANEVAGLAEWPVTLMGAFDEKFLGLPDEVLTASMKGHQKYFSVRDPKTGRLANRFVFVANLEAPDGGASMRVGYERVLTARLSDAWFLYREDLKTPLEDRIADLDRITFFEGLGTVGDKARRVATLAREIAPLVGADPDAAERAGRRAKADLVTGMVYEFPELQGLMGRYYALEQGEAADVADAIRDHYKPAGQGDEVPTAPVSVAVALADKIDTLTAFWAIDQKPTGSKDPFALRRAALGMLHILIGSTSRMELAVAFLIGGRLAMADMLRRGVTESKLNAWKNFLETTGDLNSDGLISQVLNFSKKASSLLSEGIHFEVPPQDWEIERANDLLDFTFDRLRVILLEKGFAHDRISAAAYASSVSDVVAVVARLKALDAFLETEEGANLLAAHKRAGNILKAEAKKGWDGGAVDPALFEQDEERALHAALDAALAGARDALNLENFEGAMAALAQIRAPLDAFFDAVTVNAEDDKLRANRLALLSEVSAACRPVADLAKIEG